MENSKSVLEMSSQEAKAFFLKNESYNNFKLPSNFSFFRLLGLIYENIENISIDINRAKQKDNVNYIIYGNKDGKLSYRPLQLIHPLIYVSLVKDITKEENWEKLKRRFENNFQANSKIQCYSITDIKSQTEQGTSCWSDVEQDSINLSLEYSYVYDTDIADCYGSIYTHSIAWAVETKETAKNNRRDKSLLGNSIDEHIQAMQNGQTNGIPQGSVLMDFIAEIVLGYIDELLIKKLEDKRIENYKILRYRDDYRIFVNNPHDGLNILKILSKELVTFGLKLNTYRTKENDDIISNVVDRDKLEGLKLASSLGHNNDDMLKQLLLIRQHGIDYPNSGSLVKALVDFNVGMNQNESSTQIISIALDIMLKNNHTIPICSSIISKVLENLNEKEEIIEKIITKIDTSSNSDIAKVWLQSIISDYSIPNNTFFDEKLCKIVRGESDVELWNNEWIDTEEIKALINVSEIVNQEALSNNNQ